MGKSSAKTICSYCGVGCGVVVERDAAGGLSLEGDPDYPVNRGALCSKGMNLHHAVMDRSDRLLYPEMRLHRDRPRERVSWDDAITRAARVFESLIRNHGPDSVGFYVSGQLLTEEYYLVNKLVKGFIGTANIDTNSRLCMSSAVVGYKKALGEDAVPICYDDIDECETFLIAGANPAWCHPILFRRIEKRKAEFPSTRIIVVDPRRTDSCEIADLHLAVAPGMDVTLYNAIAKVLIDRDWIDADFIRNHTNGFDELRERLSALDVRRAAARCGVDARDIETAARYIGEAGSFLSLWAMGLNQSAGGVDKNLALLNLNLITGKIGKPGSGPFSLTGQPNAMGGREVGGLSSMLAAHRDLENPEHRAEVARHWGVPAERIPDRAGLSAVEMFDALHAGKLKAVWIICTNPMVSLPDSNLVREALEKARFVVVQDISTRSDTYQYADLVLPAAGWLEKEGTMTNSERRVAHLPRLLDAPGEALPDAEILSRFGRALGHGEAFTFESVSDVYDEHKALTAGTNLDVSGLDYERLRQGSARWPVPEPGHKGTDRLFSDGRFYTQDGRARIFTPPDDLRSEATDEEYPLVLTTGRTRDQWHTMTRTGKVGRLNVHAPEPYLEIHPRDAAHIGLADGALAVVRSRRGEARLRAKVSDAARPGTVFAPMHWGRVGKKEGARANNLTNRLFDPISREPDFKYSAVSVTKYVPAPRKIVIIGAGAAAFAFIEAYRRDNRSDQIVVLSREPDPFYNRILLPEYITGERRFSSLRLAEKDFCEVNQVQIRTGISAEFIDRGAKVVRTSAGEEIAYDELIIAAGSRPRRLARLRGNPHADRIHTLRTRGDADRITREAGKSTLIIGGGLLGLELADSLLKLGRHVTLVHRSARLMSRQLDAAASDLLLARLRDRGMEIFLSDEVVGLMPAARRAMVYLASGKRLIVDSIICALGTEPDARLAREAGLRVNFGIVVDEYLNTDDPHIHAVGEVAEFERHTYGTTLAAGDQARVLARVLAGDPCARYVGSIELNILKIREPKLASMGKSSRTSDDEEEIVIADVARGLYKKYVISKDRLVGCVLVGDVSDLPRLRELHEGRIELGAERESLTGAKAAAVPRGRPVCSCNRVGEIDLEEAARAGCGDLDELVKTTGAGAGCGSCRPEVARILRRVSAESEKKSKLAAAS